MKIFDPIITGSALITGDLTVNGTINATISGSTSNAILLNNTGSARFATTGSNLFKGNQTVSGSIVPSVNDIYDLGSLDYQWRDLYLSSGSLYIDGTQVISSNSTEVIFSTDSGQSIKLNELGTDNITLQTADGDIELKSSGGGDIALDPTTGIITVKGTLQMQDGNKITSSGGNKVVFGDDLEVTGSIRTNGTLVMNGVSFSAMTSGTSGSSGSSGTSGSNGSSGTSGSSGSSGTSGSSGSNGSSGTSGSSGSSGTSGSSGSNGSSGSSGTSGSSGSSGSSGTSGSSGSSGTSGSSGSNGSSGTSGSNGSSGTSGSSGSNGSSGSSGTTTITNASADRVMTSEGGVTLNGEANLTFNGTTLYVAGALGVGTSTPTTTGLIRATNDVIAYYGSDERLKENIQSITGSLDILKQINGYYFDWKEMPGIHENEGHDIGVIAQEINSVLPEIVTTRENGYMAVKYEKLVALLIQTNKELLIRVEALESKIK
jgi:hypothetical protein